LLLFFIIYVLDAAEATTAPSRVIHVALFLFVILEYCSVCRQYPMCII